jgi:hypothetical protein
VVNVAALSHHTLKEEKEVHILFVRGRRIERSTLLVRGAREALSFQREHL